VDGPALGPRPTSPVQLKMRPEFAVVLGAADMRAMEALAASLKAVGLPTRARRDRVLTRYG
jgi:hypothetical protein